MNKLKKKPFVSVIIPVFNGSSYLEETIKFIQKSTYKHFEIILVDDGSTDKSKHICEKLEKKYKNVHFYSFVQNKGMDRCLNFALQKAKGKYICRINQDDRMLPYRIKTQVEFLEKNTDVVAVGSHIKLFNEKNFHTIVKFLEKDEEIKKFWLILSPFSDPTVLYRKKAALEVGGYNQLYWPADDVHMWYKLGSIGKLANIQKPLVEVRWHENAGSLKFMHINALNTYKLHLWADKNIAKAAAFVHLFWLSELISGLIFPANFNWAVYRGIKRLIDSYEVLKEGLRNFQNKTAPKSVRTHPKKFNLSGV